MFVVHRLLLMVSQGGDEEVNLLPWWEESWYSGFPLGQGRGEREGTRRWKKTQKAITKSELVIKATNCSANLSIHFTSQELCHISDLWSLIFIARYHSDRLCITDMCRGHWKRESGILVWVFCCYGWGIEESTQLSRMSIAGFGQVAIFTKTNRFGVVQTLLVFAC